MEQKRKVVFLDRDGVINVDTGYLYRVQDLDYVPYFFDMARFFAEQGYSFVIVTNQSGIGRGYYSEQDLHKLMAHISKDFEARNLNLLAYYYCPHHPKAKINEFRTNCSCRKPGTEMVLRATSEHALDLSEAVMIGDNISDVQCGDRAGVGLNIWISGKKTWPADEGEKPSSTLIAEFIKDVIVTVQHRRNYIHPTSASQAKLT